MRICKPTRRSSCLFCSVLLRLLQTMKTKHAHANSQHPSSLASHLQAGTSIKSDSRIIADQVNDTTANKLNIGTTLQYIHHTLHIFLTVRKRTEFFVWQLYVLFLTWWKIASHAVIKNSLNLVSLQDKSYKVSLHSSAENKNKQPQNKDN